MSIHYQALIMDEFNWEYADFSRDKVHRQIKEACPDAKIVVSSCQLIIVNMGRQPPETLVGKVTMDALYYRIDNDPMVLKSVDLSVEEHSRAWKKNYSRVM